MSSLPDLFINSIKYNCDLSDAEHAGDYSLCVYLVGEHFLNHFKVAAHSANAHAFTYLDFEAAREFYS